jgi:streptogramin lyase
MLALVTCAALAATNNVYLSQFNGSETASKSLFPVALALNGAGDVYVVGGEEPNYVVDEFGPSGTGHPLAEVPIKNKAGGSFYPYGIAISPNGDLFVADYEQNALVEYDSSGNPIAELAGSETAAKSFAPIAVAVNLQGDVYVADYAHYVVDEFGPSGAGAPIAELTGAETAATRFTPEGLAVNSSNDVYVIDNEHSVVDELGADGKLVTELTGLDTPQGSFSAYIPALAVAPSGEVYVPNGEAGVVDRLSPAGVYLSQFTGNESPQGAFQYVTLAVNSSEEVYVGTYEAKGYVDIFSAPEEAQTASQWVTEAATSITTTTATLEGTVNPEGGVVSACEFEYGTSTSYGQTIACKQTSGQIGEGTSPVAISAKVSGLEPGTKYYFRATGEGVNGKGQGDEESFTTQFEPPTATIKPVTAINGHCATFTGEVDPEGATTTYRFEDSTNGTSWTALEQVGAGEGTNRAPITQEVCDLSGSSTYHVRLLAESAGGHVTSGEESFLTPASEPQVAGVGASVLGGGDATLYATIYPEGQATSYRFEYGTTMSYGSTVPASEGTVGTTPDQVSETITGLISATVYHFRVVAINPTGPTYGTDETFTTSLIAPEGQPAGPGLCPNEGLRDESNADPDTGVSYSSELPDCRAYEQVTPPFKGVNGVNHGTYCALCGNPVAVESVSVNGAPLLARSLVPLGGAVGGTDGELNPASYELARAASGWITLALTPPASKFATATAELTSEDNADTEIWAAATPEQSIDAEDFYFHEADGTFVDIGPLAPPSATAGRPHGAFPGTGGIDPGRDAVVGASGDLTNVVYQLDSLGAGLQGVPSLLWPGDETVAGEKPSLYEYVGTGHSGDGTDVPALVGVDNGDAQISQCGTGLGPDTESEARQVHNGVSAAGSTVFFTAQAGGCETGAAGPPTNQVYARIGLPGAPQATVNVAGSSGCTVSTSCNVTGAVTFQGASSDGARAFVTAAQPELVRGDPDGTTALYECELPGDRDATPSASGKVDACPDLKALSLTGTSEGAQVQSVLAVSEEGSRVYFTAKGVLTNTPDGSLPAGHQTAQVGENNLYVWEALGDGQSSGKVSFIATLSSARPDEAEATPDGEYLVFTTTADLTSDDTSTAAQAFRYDAITDQLIRISVGQNGSNQDGNTTADAATLASDRGVSGTPNALPRSVSENGAYVVFQSSAALTPQVRGGINNVYEWHEGDVSLISDGTDTSEHAGLIGMDASGENIFFVTADKLVGQDTDEDYDVYDTRIDGGFPAPMLAPSCTGEACQSALPSPFLPPTPGSTVTPAIGNLAPATKGTLKPKSPTKAQKLSKALVSCHRDRSRSRRVRCERTARAKYGKPTKRTRRKGKP